MLDTETKRRIDTARDILVGKVPDPKSQVEQITIALIYKFMDDMDAESEEFGGKRKFFAGEYAHYGWARLMHAGLGGHEMLNLYAEAISKMPENPGIPLLFRDIFKNAYLPYRDPETLKSFLKIVDEFHYDHSERLGDAFEYLLSVLGSQGDAGQFRTPRHIIDFMVALLDPQKTDTVLDPACGTAGFLISSWKHILKSNTDTHGHSTLTPDERARLARNFIGYDISPDMVRLSLVNLYLHGFADPHIVEYDSLTSQDRWNETAEVILANPPFMSPKGGIKPHNRFSVQSKRSEVLFVDYMAEHLSANGRAAIIVPERVIFQSQTAYKKLRKMLVDESLVAVVSLPAGLFQPYSGVKTSILILDRSLAKRSNSIGFFKISNDGFGLGAQRRAIDKNDLPQAQVEIGEYLRRLRAGESVEDFQPALGLIVAKEKVAADGDYNLSGERYRKTDIRTSNYPQIPIGDICTLFNGRAFKPEDWQGPASGGVPIIRIQNLNNPDSSFNYFTGEVSERNTVNHGELLFSWSGSRGTSFGAHIWRGDRAVLNQHIFKVGFDESRATKMYLLHALNRAVIEVEENLHGGVGLVHITKGNLERIQIPLPPLDVQQEIVAEIDGYQKVIDGARAVLDNYRPSIAMDPDWPVFELNEVTSKVTDGAHFTPTYIDAGVPFLRVTDITESSTSKKFIPKDEHIELIKRCHPEKGDVLYSKNGTIGIAKLVDWDWEFSIFVSLCLIKPKADLLDPHYLTCFLNSKAGYAQATARSKSGTVTNLHLVDIKTIRIPIPPLSTQQAIVAEIEAEQALVHANRELIARFEKKIAATLARIWGDHDVA
jgi:type I restriction enzyme M protein